MVVVVDGLAASGGYIAAMASDHIVAQQSSHRRLDRRHLPVSQRHRAAEDHRRQGRGASSPRRSRPRPAASSRPARRRAPRSRRIVWIPTTGSEALVRDRRKLDAALSNVSPTAGCSPAGRRSSSSWSTRSATNRPRSPGWRKEKNIDPKTPVRDYPLRAAVQRPAVPARRRGRSRSTRSGLTALARRFEEWGAIQAVERLNLDGLLALWHPPVEQLTGCRISAQRVRGQRR